MAATPRPEGEVAPPEAALRARIAAAVAPALLLGEELGRGGMSVVHRAHDARLRRDVAIKVLPPDLAFVSGVRARFLREAQTAASLQHPHIVPIFDVAEKDGLVWIVMALVDGESLGQRLARVGRLAAPEVARIVGETCEALAYAHAHGVVHRDVKPDNILLDRATGRVLVTDFGIARAAEGDQRLTATGVAVGTPAYMSPEQAMGEHELDARSDVYSLGVVAWQMLAGAPPFAARNTPSLLLKHVSEPLPPLAPLCPAAPAGLVAAVERALRKRPDDRFDSADAFRAALVAPVSPAPVSAPAAGRAEASGSHTSVARERPAVRVELPHDVDAHDAAIAKQQREARRDREAAAREAAWAPPAPPAPLAPAPPRPFREAMRAARAGGAPGELPQWLRDAYARGDIVPIAGNAGTLEWQARRFRARWQRSVVLVGMLAVINLVTAPFFWWWLFPAFGMAMGLLARWRPLGDAGVRLGDVLRGDFEAIGAKRQLPARLASESLGGRVRRFVRRAKVAASTVAAGVLSLAAGAVAGAEGVAAFGGVVLFGGILASVAALGTAAPLRRIGFGWKELVDGTWRDGAAARQPDVQRRLRDELVLELAPPDVVRGAYGDRLRAAADDRMAIRAQWGRLDGETAARLAEVPQTADELLARIAQLCGALHAIERDIGEAGTADVEGRVAELRRRGQSADTQTLALLERQRTALAEFAQRRDALRGQLDRAALALQNLRLDLLRIQSAGRLVDAGVAPETPGSATEHARAVSKDLAYLLEGVREVERL